MSHSCVRSTSPGTPPVSYAQLCKSESKIELSPSESWPTFPTRVSSMAPWKSTHPACTRPCHPRHPACTRPRHPHHPASQGPVTRHAQGPMFNPQLLKQSKLLIDRVSLTPTQEDVWILFLPGNQIYYLPSVQPALPVSSEKD